MQIGNYRPDPDELLSRIQSEEARSKRGKLKIFLGYVAGVGKTYAMLEAAHQRLEEGTDVVIGYVETHGRQETEDLINGLEIIPRRLENYRGKQLSEMDIDAIISRHPELVLVDELAHTNIPGSRHRKRFQDVEEILNIGINVYSTVNIQHLESLSDVVQQITGVFVREKIPDRIVDEADEIELIDLPTDELIKRLQVGKVYITDQARRALEKFFRKGNLTALRQISLRRAADRVDDQMRNYMQSESIPGPWPASERILVCINSNPMSDRLIRSGKRLADHINADWHVIFVETPQNVNMTLEKRLRVQRFLSLAEELGGQVIYTAGEDIAETVLDFAHEHNVTKIMAGKPYKPRIIELIRGSVVDKIIRKSGDIDVYVVSGGPEVSKNKQSSTTPSKRTYWRYGVSLLMVVLVTIIGQPLKIFLEPTNLVMGYLLAVLLSAVYLGRGPSILASILSVLVFDFFFTKPIYTFTVNDTQYLITFFGLLAVGLSISSLASMLRDQVVVMKNKDHQTQSLLYLSHEFTAAVSLEQVLEITIRTCSFLLNQEIVILLPTNDRLKIRQATRGLVVDENEQAVAEWAFKNGQMAGNGTDTLPASNIRFLPLLTANGTIGILGIKSQSPTSKLDNEQRLLLEGITNLTALAVERAILSESAAQTEMLLKTEKLQTALLNSISHELRTPLASITGVLTSLADSEKAHLISHKLDIATRIELLDSATGQAIQLNRLVENLLNMTRLEAGSVRLNLELCDVQDLIGTVLNQFNLRLKEHPIKLEIPDNTPLISCDVVLIAQVITNLLDNACKFSLPGAPIAIYVVNQVSSIEISIIDSGQGINEDEIDKIFNKFYRGSFNKPLTGTGLGLSICKGIIEVHGGWIKAMNNPSPGHGLTIKFSLPLKEKVKDIHE